LLSAVILVACAPLVCGLALGQQEPFTKTGAARTISSGLRREIHMREDAVWRAAKNRDMTAFRELVAADARMVFPSGVMTRQQYINAAGERIISSYTIADFDAFLMAPDVVITTYKATVSGVFGGRAVPPTTIREASVWVKRTGKWVAVWNQETPFE
jgi:hypothetical protein